MGGLRIFPPMAGPMSRRVRPPWCVPRSLPWRTLWALLLALLLWGAASRAGAADEAEYRIKAAFLCKFGNYIDWPAGSFPGPDASFAIGVLAAPAVADAVAAVAAGQMVNGRPIAVRALAQPGSLQGLQVVFVARSHAARLPELLAASKEKPLLVVTEWDDALQAGSVINFVVVDDKVKFDIAPAAAERGGLHVSARLLGVARSVAGRAS